MLLSQKATYFCLIPELKKLNNITDVSESSRAPSSGYKKKLNMETYTVKKNAGRGMEGRFRNVMTMQYK